MSLDTDLKTCLENTISDFNAYLESVDRFYGTHGDLKGTFLNYFKRNYKKVSNEKSDLQKLHNISVDNIKFSIKNNKIKDIQFFTDHRSYKWKNVFIELNSIYDNMCENSTNEDLSNFNLDSIIREIENYNV